MPFTALGLMPELVRAVADEGYEHPTPFRPKRSRWRSRAET